MQLWRKEPPPPPPPPGELHLDAEVWGPHFWFFLHTVAYTYPEFPCAATRRKYYDLIMNLPLFLPLPRMGADFALLLDQHPIAPYLATRESLMRWMHFVHNRYRRLAGRPPLPFFVALQDYVARYRRPVVRAHFDRRLAARIAHLLLALALLALLAHQTLSEA